MAGLQRITGKLGCGYPGWKSLLRQIYAWTGHRSSQPEPMIRPNGCSTVNNWISWISPHMRHPIFAWCRLACQRGIPIICQKPIAPDWEGAIKIVNAAEAAGVRLMIHENWRWQPWYRVAHEMITRGRYRRSNRLRVSVSKAGRARGRTLHRAGIFPARTPVDNTSDSGASYRYRPVLAWRD